MPTEPGIFATRVRMNAMRGEIDGISLADYPVIDEAYVRDQIGDADILMIGCKACGSTHNIVAAHDLTKLIFVCADCGAPIGLIDIGEQERVEPDQYAVKHVTKGYLKRRGHSDEPSLDFVEDIGEAKHYSYEGALRLANTENTLGITMGWSVEKVPNG